MGPGSLGDLCSILWWKGLKADAPAAGGCVCEWWPGGGGRQCGGREPRGNPPHPWLAPCSRPRCCKPVQSKGSEIMSVGRLAFRLANVFSSWPSRVERNEFSFPRRERKYSFRSRYARVLSLKKGKKKKRKKGEQRRSISKHFIPIKNG